MKSERCPVSGQGTLQREITIESFECKGRSLTIPGYAVEKCSVCSEAIIDRETLKTSRRILKAFKHEVDERRL